MSFTELWLCLPSWLSTLLPHIIQPKNPLRVCTRKALITCPLTNAGNKATTFHILPYAFSLQPHVHSQG